MGKNPGKRKLAQGPVENVSYDDMVEFCRRISEKNEKKVRLPTDAEWEYAAHVGTSTPCLTGRYDAQNAHVYETIKGVKTMAPNAWGLYDMIGMGWEANADWAASNVRIKQLDPIGPAENDPSVRDYGNGHIRKSRGGDYYNDYRPSMHGGWTSDGIGAEGITTFRVVVEK